MTYPPCLHSDERALDEHPLRRATARVATERRRGIALLSALTALLLVSLATVGLFHLTLAETRRARAAGFLVQASAGADGGALTFMRDWRTAAWDTLYPGDRVPLQTHTFGSATASVEATRLSPHVWHVVSSSQSGDSSARTLSRRRVNALFRLAIPDLAEDAALTVRDSVRLQGSARVVGTDTATGVWAIGCAPGVAGAGVASPDTTRICDGTCATHSGTHATGVPDVIQDSTAASAARYSAFGSESWSTLTAHASVVIPGGSVVTPSAVVLNGACDRMVASNWGDPSAITPCWSYAPVLWAQGDLEMRGGLGQGLLLVDGDFTLSQGAEFHGVVIARDDVLGGGGGGRLLGLAMAGDMRTGPGDHSLLGDGVQINLSRCAVQGALRRSARLVPLVRRWWAAIR